MEVPVKALIIIYIILFFLVLFAYFLLIMSLAQGPSWLGYPGAWLRHLLSASTFRLLCAADVVVQQCPVLGQNL